MIFDVAIWDLCELSSSQNDKGIYQGQIGWSSGWSNSQEVKLMTYDTTVTAELAWEVTMAEEDDNEGNNKNKEA